MNEEQKSEELTEKECDELFDDFSRALCVALTGSDAKWKKHKEKGNKNE